MEIVLATDADWIVDEVTAALGSPDIGFLVTASGPDVARIVAEREVGVVVLDLQIGSMGGFAIARDLRNDESSGLLPHVPIVLLLDRQADVYLAQQSGADGWLVKPIDPLKLKRAVAHVANGQRYPNAEPGIDTADVPDTADTSTPESAAAATDTTVA